MGTVYHSSKQKGLTELHPRFSKHKATHGENFIYATKSRELALFMSARITDLYSVTMGEGTKENPAILVERLPGIFDKFLHCSTTIYSLDDKDFYPGTQWEGEVVTQEKQQILSEEHIPDVYSELERAVADGRVKMFCYPDRPPEIPKDNSDLIEHMMLPIYRSTEDFGIVKTMLHTYPKLFPKIIKSLAADPKLFAKALGKSFLKKINNATKKIGNRFQLAKKKELLPSGEENINTPKSNSFKESLRKGAPSLQDQAKCAAEYAVRTQQDLNKNKIINEGPEHGE